MHDDGLFIRLATDIASGRWLGGFSQYTLMKGPGFPLFLAATSLSGLPLSATNGLLQIAAVSIAAWAVYRLTGSLSVAAALFIILMFSPVGFVLRRVNREETYWAQTVLVFSLLMVILFAPPRGRIAAIAVAAIAGLVFGWTWITREEGIWFIPGLGVLIGGAFFIGRKQSSVLIALVRNLGVAAIAFSAVIAAFMTANFIAYGAWIGVDFKERNFTATINALQSIDVGPVIPHVPVSYAARMAAAKVSSAFAPLNAELVPGGPLSGWEDIGCEIYKETCGDIAGGWFMWALRDAAALHGFYRSPRIAADNFGKIANEITAACSDGRLDCRRRWLSYMPQMTSEQWAGLPATFAAAVVMLAHPFERDAPRLGSLSSATTELTGELERDWAFLNFPRIKTFDPNHDMTVVGWYYDSQSAEWPLFKVYANDGRPIPSTITLRASRDLQQLFSDDSAGNNRFQLAFRCPDTCTIVAATTRGPELRLVLDRNRSLSVASGKAKLYVDSVSGDVTSFVSPGERFAEAIRIGLVRLYNIVIPLILLGGAIAIVAASYRAVRMRTADPILVTAFAAWVLVATRIVILVLIDLSAFPAIRIGYSSPAYFMAIIAAVVSMAAIGAQMRCQISAAASRLGLQAEITADAAACRGCVPAAH